MGKVQSSNAEGKNRSEEYHPIFGRWVLLPVQCTCLVGEREYDERKFLCLLKILCVTVLPQIYLVSQMANTEDDEILGYILPRDLSHLTSKTIP